MVNRKFYRELSLIASARAVCAHFTPGRGLVGGGGGGVLVGAEGWGRRGRVGRLRLRLDEKRRVVGNDDERALGRGGS